MTITAFLPILVFAVGLVVYLVPSKSAKVTEAGRLAMFAGLLVTLLSFASHVVRLGPH